MAELPETFAPLGTVANGVVAEFAARRLTAHPDADVIDLAGRLEALAERHEARSEPNKRLLARVQAEKRET